MINSHVLMPTHVCSMALNSKYDRISRTEKTTLTRIRVLKYQAMMMYSGED